MTVRAAHRVRQRGLQCLGGQQVGAFEVLACAGVADDQISHDVLRLDQPFRYAGLQSQSRGSHIAARARNSLGTRQRLTLTGVCAIGSLAGDELRHAVSPVLVEIAAIEFIPCGLFFETMIGTEIHDHGIRVELGCELAGSAMRQGKDNDIVAVEHLRRGVFNNKIGQLRNMRHMPGHRFPHGGMACHTCDCKVGVCRKNAQRLTAGIACSTGYGHCIFRHTHLFSADVLRMSIRDYADYCIVIQWVCCSKSALCRDGIR